MKAKNHLSFLNKILLFVNVLLWIGLLLSYMAPFTDPRKAWAIAFFGLGYPILITFNLILLVYWLFSKKLFALISLVIVACGWNILRNNVELHSPSSYSNAPGVTVVRMMTYNVHNFKRYGSSNDRSTRHEILQIIGDEQPDIIGFQEFYTRYHGQYNMRDSIVKIMGADNYYFEPVIFNASEAIGLAVFSKFPIIAHGLIRLSEKLTENSCIYIDVKKNGKMFRVYSLHLQSIRFDPEDYKYLSKISDPGKTDMTSTRRLGSKLKSAFIKEAHRWIS